MGNWQSDERAGAPGLVLGIQQVLTHPSFQFLCHAWSLSLAVCDAIRTLKAPSFWGWVCTILGIFPPLPIYLPDPPPSFPHGLLSVFLGNASPLRLSAWSPLLDVWPFPWSLSLWVLTFLCLRLSVTCVPPFRPPSRWLLALDLSLSQNLSPLSEWLCLFLVLSPSLGFSFSPCVPAPQDLSVSAGLWPHSLLLGHCLSFSSLLCSLGVSVCISVFVCVCARVCICMWVSSPVLTESCSLSLSAFSYFPWLPCTLCTLLPQPTPVSPAAPPACRQAFSPSLGQSSAPALNTQP